MMVMMQHRNSFASYIGQWQKNTELVHAGAGLQILVRWFFFLFLLLFTGM